MKKLLWYGHFCFLIIQHLAALNPVCTISVPKCGTHLLNKLIGLIRAEKSMRSGFNILEQEMKQFPFVSSHAIYNQHNSDIHKKYNRFSYIFIYRDPRAQIVSMAHWLRKVGRTTLPVNELITSLMFQGYGWYTNFNQECPFESSCVSTVTDFYNLYIPWIHVPGIYVTTFEKLVGPQGGGTLQNQYQEIANIAKHMGVHLNQKQIATIAQTLFGESATFREGKIDSWKNYFTPGHKELFKKHGGQLLITLGYEKDFNW